MVTQIKTITSVTEQGLQVIKQAQDASTVAFNEFTNWKLAHILETTLNPVVENIRQVASATASINNILGAILTLWSTRDRPAIAPEQQEKIFLCMRALNRVEDLTVDKEPGLEQNNNALAQITRERRPDALYRDCLSVLEGAPALQERVTSVHGSFNQTDPEEGKLERLARLLEIQKLRGDIIAYFAVQPLAVPDVPSSADEQPKQDQQP